MMLPVITSGGEVPLTTAVVTGVAKERVDPRTLQLLDELFPGHHGLEFAARLLRLAEAKQLTLSELGYTDMADVAVITIQSIRALAKCIGWSYDTTEKYLVVLCCLRLLYKQRSRHQIVLYFPLRRCQLPKPEALDRIQELRPGKRTPRYREKVRGFASQVKRRFVLLCKKGDGDATLPSPDPADSSHFSRLLLQDIHDILRQEVDSETHHRLLLKIENAISSRCMLLQRRLFSTTGDAEEEEGVIEGSVQGKKPSFSLPKGDSVGTILTPQSRLFGGKGDSDGEMFSFQEEQSSFGFEKGDSRREAVPHQSRLSEPKGDSVGSALIRHHQKSPFGSEKGDSERGSAASESRLFGTKDDFSHEQSIVEGTLQEQKATRISTKGDSVGAPLASQSRLSPKKGDSVGAWASPDEQESSFSRPKGDSVELEGADREEKATFSEPKDDFSPTAAGSLNDNVRNNYIYITEKRDDNVNDPAAQINQTSRCSGREAARIGQHLAYFLEKNGANAGGFVNKVKACGPMIVQAAVIDLLVHHAFPLVDPTDLRGRPEHNARWFHGACNHFAVPGTPLPAYVTKWLSTGFSWQKIEQELARAAAKYERFMHWEETGNLVRAFLRGEISEQEVDARLIEVEQQRARQVTPGSISEGHVVLDVNQLSMNEAEARLLATVMPGELDALCEEIAALGGRDLPRGATASAKEMQGNVWEVELKWKKLPFPVCFSSLRRWRQYLDELREGEKWELARKAAGRN